MHNHNFKDGQIVRDTQHQETFIFEDKRDGFKAEHTDVFRLATEQEKKVFNENNNKTS